MIAFALPCLSSLPHLRNGLVQAPLWNHRPPASASRVLFQTCPTKSRWGKDLFQLQIKPKGSIYYIMFQISTLNLTKCIDMVLKEQDKTGICNYMNKTKAMKTKGSSDDPQLLCYSAHIGEFSASICCNEK